MIIIKSKTEDPFARIPVQLLNDSSLKWKEKGLLCYLLSKPMGWKLRIADLQARSGDGRDAIYASLNALISAGYCQRTKSRDDMGLLSGYEYAIADAPIFTENPYTENPCTDNPTHSKKDSSKNEELLFKELNNEPKKKKDTFPWKEVIGIFHSRRPDKKYRTNPKGVTDRNVKAFWRRNGKVMLAFEKLCDKINESKYLMGKDAFEGIFPQPDPNWSWVFAKNPNGEWRCDKIMEGAYSDEKMSFVVERKTETIKAVIVGLGERTINPLEKTSSGLLVYEKIGTDDYTGLDKYIKIN